jgi:hypothetical protein
MFAISVVLFGKKREIKMLSNYKINRILRYLTFYFLTFYLLGLLFGQVISWFGSIYVFFHALIVCVGTYALIILLKEDEE